MSDLRIQSGLFQELADPPGGFGFGMGDEKYFMARTRARRVPRYTRWRTDRR